MKRFICLIFILLPSLCYAGPEIMLMAANHKGATTEGCTTGVTKINCQNFETPTTGYDNGETWTQYSGTGCTYAPATVTSPLRGSQSLVMVGTAASECYDSSPGVISTASYSVFFRVNVSAAGGTTSLVRWYAPTGGTVVGEIGITATGSTQWYIKNGTVTAYSLVGAHSIGTSYNVWCDWTGGTGSNGTMYLYVAPIATTAKPGSPTASITTGNASSNTTGGLADIIGQGVTVKFDQWMDSTSVMGNVTP